MKRVLAVLLALACLAPVAAQGEATSYSLDTKSGANLVKIEIPAPLETTRAKLSGVRGSLNVDPSDLSKTAGTIEVDLTGIEGFSFEDAGKNKTQTEHMKNWFVVGSDVTADVREKNRWAKFTITKIAKAEAVPNTNKFSIQAVGDFTVHGITKPKTIDLEVTIDEGKKAATISTKMPFNVSLKEHDVKPRDTAGKFLSGTLQVIGLKLSDEAKVSLELKALAK